MTTILSGSVVVEVVDIVATSAAVTAVSKLLSPMYGFSSALNPVDLGVSAALLFTVIVHALVDLCCDYEIGLVLVKQPL